MVSGCTPIMQCSGRLSKVRAFRFAIFASALLIAGRRAAIRSL